MNTAQRILKERQARKTTFKIGDFLFKEQLAFVHDPARFAVACTSVRAGKSTSCAADLVDTAIKLPGTVELYVTLTRSHAKKIVWPELLRINRTYKCGAVPNLVDLSLTFPNGSVIYCGGANTEAEMEKYRGLSNVALAYVDEAQSMRAHIRTLITDVLVKRLYDTNGRCRVIGTPGPVPSGYFYEVTRSPAWSHHHWTLHQNLPLQKKSGKTATELIAQDCEMQGVGIDHPSIQRECFGRWVPDNTSLVLLYTDEKNHFSELPNRKWEYVMGVDLGFVDADAIAVLAYSDDGSDTYLVHEEVTAKQDLTSLAERVRTLQQLFQVNRTVIDEGGLGKKMAEEMRVRWGLPLEAAEKTRKWENLKLLDDALRSGRFKARKDSRFAADCMEMKIDRARSTPDRMKVSDDFHSDIIDAVLYSFKLSPAYAWSPKEKKLVKGSREWFMAQARIDWEEEAEKLKKDEVGYGEGWPSSSDDRGGYGGGFSF
jgi:hypothetical protein